MKIVQGRPEGSQGPQGPQRSEGHTLESTTFLQLGRCLTLPPSSVTSVPGFDWGPHR